MPLFSLSPYIIGNYRVSPSRTSYFNLDRERDSRRQHGSVCHYGDETVIENREEKWSENCTLR